MRIRKWHAMVGVCALLAGVQAHAQDQYADEYTRRLKIHQTIDPHGPTPFGEQLNPYTGDLTFTQTDVVLEGIGPTIRLARNHVSMQLGEGILQPYSMGDWTLSIPRIETLADVDWHVAVAVNPGLNWNVGTADPANNLKRCTFFDRPAFHGTLDDPFKGWNGMTLVSEDGNQQSVLKRNAALNPSRPTIAEATVFPAVTQQSWQIGCLAQTSNGEEGEAFLVVSPDGTKYWLDHLSGVRAVGLREPDPAGSGETLHQGRMLAWMYASRIEDRFGNWVQYHYNGDELDYIDASDGRYVDITWLHVDGAALVSDIEVQPGSTPARKWHYDYATATDSSGYVDAVLTAVTLPDQSRWTFALDSIGAQISDLYLDRCDALKVRDEGDLYATTPSYRTSTIKHPSGLIGTFKVRSTWHGRSYVESGCVNDFNGVEHEAIPPLFGTMSLVSKQFSGPGLVTQTWTYNYSSAVGSTTQDPCASTGTCAATSWVDVVDPEGNRTRHTYSTRWGPTEGKEIKTDYYQGTTLLRSVSLAYAPFDGGPYPVNLGSTMMDWHTNSEKQETLTPLDRTQITQQGVTFTHDATAFDAFARELAVHDYNSQGRSRYLSTTYHDSIAKWALGQVASTTIGGTVVSQTTFDANDLPWKTYSYGKLKQTSTYNADGTINTVADGRGNTTTLGSWKRGIPQSIQFPATPEAPSGAMLAAQVNDLGQLDWTEDPDGYRTCYAYDVMGRLASLTYPSETQAHTCNTSKWSRLARAFVLVASSEYGIGANHWRETVTTGNHETITYFDALWQPLIVRERDTSDASTTRFSGFAYDSHGRKSFTAYPSTTANASQGVFTAYDTLGRVTQVTQDSEIGPLTTLTAYLSGFQTRVTNPRGNATTTTSYLAWGAPSTELPLEIAHPAGAFTTISRDPSLGTPTAITRHNANSSLSEARRLIYNANREVCKQIEPETGTSVVHYDAAGNVDWTAAAQNSLNTVDCSDVNSVPTVARVIRAYDARNRLLSLSFPDINGSQSWRYTADGLPVQVDTMNEDGNATVTNTFSYNHRRLLTGEIQIQPGTGNKSLGYAYDSNGVLAALTYPNGRTVGYAPNALGQPTQAGGYATAVRYYPNGGMSGFNYGNGIVHTMTQNVRQLPEQSIDSGGVLNDSYDYDQNGNVLAISDGLAGATGNRDMTYDALDRLLTTDSPMFGGTTAAYTYDVLDNLTHTVAPGRDWYYCYDASWRLTNLKTGGCAGVTVVGLGYDTHGNLSNKNGQQYTFDLGNRLRRATNKETYRYDANGRRATAIAESGSPAVGTIYSFYGQDGVLRYQRDERQGKETDYITLNGSLVAGISTPIAPVSVGLSVPAASYTGDYTVNWTAAGSATSYNLQEQVGSGSWSTIQSGSTVSRSITGKPNGTYHYRAQACNATGCSGWSNTGTIAVTLPPSQVPSITAPDTSTGSYTVSWGPSATADSYTLQERIDGGSWATVYTGSNLSQPYAGKAVAYYDYKVRACNVGGCSAYSAAKTVQVLLPPAGTPVISVPATSYTGSYTVSWTTAPTADSYDLQEYAGGAWTTIQSGSATSRAISGRGNGTYTYRARGCNASGCGSWGNEANITVTLPPSQVPTLTVPATSYTGSYTATWTSSATATSYTLQEYASGSWSTSYSGASLSKAYSGKGAGTYSYRVQACNVGGCSGWSATDTITVTLKPSSAPSLTVPASSSTGSYTVSWTGVSAATSYQLDEQVGSGSWTQLQNTSALSKALSGKADGSYSYRVRACNVAGCGGYSTTDTITVLTPPTATATITTPADNYTGSYSVTWTAVTKATSYTLQRKIGSGSYATVYTGASRSWAASAQSPNTYSYRVEGCNSAGCGPWSAVKSTVVHGPPAMPATLTGSKDVEYEFRPPVKNFYISWSATSDTDHYEVQQSINGSTPSVVWSGTATTYSDSGLNQIREFWVRACNAAGCSAWKGPLSL